MRPRVSVSGEVSCNEPSQVENMTELNDMRPFHLINELLSLTITRSYEGPICAWNPCCEI